MPPKPGWKSTEFWMSLIALMGPFLMQSNIIPIDFPFEPFVNGVAGTIAVVYYIWSRTKIKTTPPVS